MVNPNPVNNTPHVVDGRIYAIIQVGNKMIAGGSFTNVRQTANSANIARSRIFAFDATTGAIDTGFVPDIDGDVYSLVATPDGTSSPGAPSATSTESLRKSLPSWT